MPPISARKILGTDALAPGASNIVGLSPLTGAQQNIWFHQQLDPHSAAYHLSYYCRLLGPFDPARLGLAIDYAIATIEPLRAQFVVNEGRPYQRTQSKIAAGLQVVDLSGSADPEQLALNEMRDLQARRLDLERGEVCRFILFKLAPDKWIWQWVVHHICIDGVGAEVLIQTVSKAYRENLFAGQADVAVLSHHTVTWSQAIQDDYAYSQSEQWVTDRAYWERKLQDLDSPASMCHQELDELYIGQHHRRWISSIRLAMRIWKKSEQQL
jgi:nonribosomal peptide synthetase DhbF